MAKDKTKFAQESANQPNDRKYLMDPDMWDRSPATEFGGQSEIMTLEEGECAGPFQYIGSQPMITDLGETNGHLAEGPDHDTYRLPISASFLRSVDQAGLKRGDAFAIRRHTDTVKKKGVGKGTTMAIYSIKVLTRSTVQTA